MALAARFQYRTPRLGEEDDVIRRIYRAARWRGFEKAYAWRMIYLIFTFLLGRYAA